MSTDVFKTGLSLVARIAVEVFTANRQFSDEEKWKLMKAMEEAASGAVDTVARIAAIFNRRLP